MKGAETIRTESYLAQLRAVATRYDFPLEEIEAVQDIMQWCNERGIEENNSWRVGKCLRNRTNGKYRILLAAEITPEIKNSVLAAMEYRGFGNEVSSLEASEKFLEHLLLHEIAHAKHETWEEKDCDKWAFNELKGPYKGHGSI
ncbi:MAG TPA: hypothetical protein VK448_07590 [Dissulfurispiraceae bacterium]|nr:hypothetical protein [Dissulfurispiraceae bacterium]